MGVTRLVRKDGSGAYLDHASAFLACGAGDTVETGDSETYTERVTIYALAGQSWIVSPGCTPTVTHYLGNTVTVNDGAINLTINGVTLANSGTNSCMHLMGESTGLVIDGCAFTGANATAISGEYYAPGQDVTLVDSTITCKTGLYAPIFAALDVRRCTIAVTIAFLIANSWAGTIDRCEITLSGQAYLSASIAYSGTYSDAVLWTNCLILDMTDSGSITMLSVYNTTTPYSILGCTIVGVGAYALANIPCIWMDVKAANLGQIAIRGNIITGFKSGLRGNFGTYTDNYNDVWGCGTNWAAGTAQGSTSISADPLFVGGGDYRITGASPCLGASTNLTLTEDLDGAARPLPGELRYDIGCYNGTIIFPAVTYTAEESPEPTIIYATDLAGVPLDGFAPFDIEPMPGQPIVTLAQLVLVSLLSDREALTSDVIPDAQDGRPVDRRGWWADAYTPGERLIGSRLWLRVRMPVSDATVDEVRADVEQALAWMQQDGHVSRWEITTEAQDTGSEKARIAIGIVGYKPDGTGVRLQFPDLWALYS